MITTTTTVEPLASEDDSMERIERSFARTDPSSPALIWIGIVITALGFTAIAFAWGKVADIVEVSRQLPYVVSGGITGLSLVMVGMTVINVGSRRQDAAERARQFQELQAVLRELRETLER